MFPKLTFTTCIYLYLFDLLFVYAHTTKYLMKINDWYLFIDSSGEPQIDDHLFPCMSAADRLYAVQDNWCKTKGFYIENLE